MWCSTMDELFVGDALAPPHRTPSSLHRSRPLARLLAVHDSCDNDAIPASVILPVVRPWFHSDNSGSKKWTFESIEEGPRPDRTPRFKRSAELAHTRLRTLGHNTTTAQVPPAKAPFSARMRAYIPIASSHWR